MSISGARKYLPSPVTHILKRLTSSFSSPIYNESYREKGTLIGENHCDSEISQYRNGFHNWKMDWRKLLPTLLALCLPVLFPTIHMYIFSYLWGDMKIPVDEETCNCSCWDSIFKGPYENGTPHYKHVYFNSDGTTLKIWVLTVLGVVSLYEVFKLLFSLLLTHQLRWSMALLLLSSLHSNYYSWWAFWNFWNDDYYLLWYHQLVFSLTELTSSLLVLRYVDRRRGIQPIPMLVIFGIALFHAFSSAWDQFMINVVLGQGELHQILRDLPLMTTDIIHATLSIYAIRTCAVRKGVSFLSLLSHRSHLAVVLGVNMVMYVCLLVSPQLEPELYYYEIEIASNQTGNLEYEDELVISYNRQRQLQEK